MRYPSDITQMSKSDLQSEINAITSSDFPRFEHEEYLAELNAEYYKRIEDECQNSLKG